MGPDQTGIHGNHAGTADHACAGSGGQDHREGRGKGRQCDRGALGSTAGLGQAGFLPAGTGQGPERVDQHDPAVRGAAA